MTLVALSLGSNLQPEHHLRVAIAALQEKFGELQLSPVYRTQAVGFDGAEFLNAAAVIDTDMDAYALNDWLHALEDANNRDRSGPRYGDRSLDIDIVLFGDLHIEGSGHLQIPRPELRHAFVLKPLADIAPHWQPPGSRLTLAALWKQHPDAALPIEVVQL